MKFLKYIIITASLFFLLAIIISSAPKILKKMLVHDLERSSVKISNITIKLNKEWMVLSHSAPFFVFTRDGSIKMSFSLIDKNYINNLKNNLKKSNIPFKDGIIKVDNRDAQFIETNFGKDKDDMMNIFLEPDINISVILNSHNLDQNRERAFYFLNNNIRS